MFPKIMRSGIYKITNMVNGKFYIGSAVDIRLRWYEHRCDLRGGRHHGKALQRACNKYGLESFAFERLLICKPEHLIFYEQRALDVLKPEYNCLKVAGSFLGHKHSPETIAKLTEKRKTQVRPPCSPETRARISAAHKGKKHPGRTAWSPEARARLSANRKGKPLTPKQMEARKRKGLMSRGVPRKPEHIANAREGLKASWALDERKEKRRMLMRAFWENPEYREKQRIARLK